MLSFSGTSQVINHGVQHITVAAQGRLPHVDALRKQIRRQRQQIHAPPPNPANLAQLAIPQPSQYTQYEYQPGHFERFLLDESPQGPDKIVILGRESNLDMLVRSDRWYVDGTFKIAPLIFSQVSHANSRLRYFFSLHDLLFISQ